MICPKCTAPDDDRVIDSRLVYIENSIRRRRECMYCGYRWTTYERSVPDWRPKEIALMKKVISQLEKLIVIKDVMVEHYGKEAKEDVDT